MKSRGQAGLLRPGKGWDPSNLYDDGARLYDPMLSRFVSVDLLQQHNRIKRSTQIKEQDRELALRRWAEAVRRSF